MPLSLAEYADSLERRDLIWPSVTAPVAVKAKPSVAKLPGIKLVLWDVYGTLLRTPDGGVTLFPEAEVRLQVALEKTIHEFNMWNSMFRKPGPPWQSMIEQYRDYAKRLSMIATTHRGDFTDVNLVTVWRAVVDRLLYKEYIYDRGVYGDEDELSEKIAYFFHRNLQATEARAGTFAAISELSEFGVRQAVLADAQPFTMVQLTRALVDQGLSRPVFEYFSPQDNVLSCDLGIRKPSRSLFDQATIRAGADGVEPDEILHVSCRLKTDLVPAKQAGMKTALLAAEKSGLEAPSALIKDPGTRPDRLLTDISQITSVVGYG